MKISLGNYIPRDSFVHHLDPRVKLLLMALGIGVCFHIDTLLGLGLFLGMCLCMTKLAAIPLKRLFSGLAPFLWLFVFTALLHVFMTPGKPLPLLPLATREGLNNGLRVGIQLVYAIWISTLMTLTTSPLDMVWALEWFMRPLKYLRVPVDEIALLVMLAIRFIPLLFEETDRILKAQKARGVDLETGGMLRKVKAFVPVIVPLLHGVFRRADDLAIALTLRGYAPGTKRSRMKENKARTSDIIALLSTAAVLLVFIWL